MSVVCIGIGDAVMGCRTLGPNGEVIKETKAHWDHNPEGGAVAIWTTDGETDEPEASLEVYGDWDAAHYLARVLELLHPRRQINVPDLKGMILAADRDGYGLCDYCQRCGYDCRDCIITEWKEEGHDE